MRATTFFPLGAIAVSIFSFLHPDLLLPYKGYIVPLLGLVMLGMGMTLHPDNFGDVLRRPKSVTLGVSLAIYPDAVYGLDGVSVFGAAG